MRDPAYRRYLRRLAAAAALYVAAILAATRLLDHGAAPSALAIGIALVPGLAVVLMILAIGRLLIEMEDEFLRMIEVRKAMIATGVTLAVTSVWELR
jgi:multisubunit Na+/H+ antiporter MnhB subunit